MGKNRIKFEFLIHDLKVPLAVIEAGLTSLLQREDKYGTLTEKQDKVLRRTLRNTKITRRLVDDALEVGRSTEGIINEKAFLLHEFIGQSVMEIFDLTDYTAAEEIKGCVNLSVFKETISKKGILLSIDEKLWCREVCLDEYKMRQILRNLLNNALKYRKKQIELKIEERDGTLIICVSDDGQGIPETYHKKIFECYFQMDQEKDHCVRGHGLGLAGVMVLVEDMRGRLLLESDEGKGAAFSIMIPLNRPQ